MIQLIRIDDRLIHGQVAYSLKSALGYEAIVIADDLIVKDNIRKSALKMAVPSGVKFAVRSIYEAAELLKNPKLENIKVLVICANPYSVYSLLQLIDEKVKINLGGMQSMEGKKMFSRAVYLNLEDIKYLDLIDKSGFEIEVRQTLSESIQNYKTLRQKFNI